MIPLDDLIAATGAEVAHAGAHAIFDGFAHDSRAVFPGACFASVVFFDGSTMPPQLAVHSAAATIATAKTTPAHTVSISPRWLASRRQITTGSASWPSSVPRAGRPAIG